MPAVHKVSKADDPSVGESDFCEAGEIAILQALPPFDVEADASLRPVGNLGSSPARSCFLIARKTESPLLKVNAKNRRHMANC
jgi:hypothetical protein